MSLSARADLLGYYDEHFAPGMVDLSASFAAEGDAGYCPPPGNLALRTAIAARYEAVTPSDVVVTTGASGALAATALAILQRGDRVLAPGAVYPTFPALAQAIGATMEAHPGARPATAILLCNPTIPGGALHDIESWVAQARDCGASLIVDEVYRELGIHAPVATAAADLDGNAVSIGDLSKPLGLAGLRIGWVASRDQALLAAIGRQVQLLSGGASAPSAAAALAAFAAFDASTSAILVRARKSAAEAYAILDRFGWRYERPRAGLTVLAWPPEPLGPWALEDLLAQGLFLLPAECFGFPGAVRVSLLHPHELERALRFLECRRTSRGTLILLTKAPVAGTSKTRLAADIGPEAAAAFAAAFVRDSLALATASVPHVTVAVPAPGADRAMRLLAPAARYVEQPEGDLGDRIASAIEGALDAGPAVLIGSDTPNLPPVLIKEALAALTTADIVLGPANDGGFYLIGARRFDRRLFDGVPWSSSSVFARVLENARAEGFSVAVLEPWGDVDDLPSLEALAERLEPGAAPATAALLTGWRGGTEDVC